MKLIQWGDRRNRPGFRAMIRPRPCGFESELERSARHPFPTRRIRGDACLLGGHRGAGGADHSVRTWPS